MRRGWAVGVTAMVVLAACGGDAAPTTTGAAPVVTTSAATTTTTAPAVTTTSMAMTTTVAETTTPVETTTTTTLAPSVCPAAVPLAEGIVVTAGAAGDFDGDGAADEAFTYQVGPDDWRLRVVFADGGAADAPIVDGEDFVPPRALGGYDIDGDGPQEAFVHVGSGASAALVGLFDVADCVATRITAGGVPAVFGVGGSIGAISGISCAGDGTIHRNFASYIDQDTYEGGFEPFTLSGSVLIAGPGDGAGFTADEAFALAVLDCGSLSL